MGTNREVKARGSSAAPPKQAKVAGQPISAQNETPLFCFRHADRATQNAWAFKPTAGDATGLFQFICEMGRLKWSEIGTQTSGGHKKHHRQQISSLDVAAQKDITKARLDEVFGGEIYRFRLTAKQRLWGFRGDRAFHVLWWDPEHKVYPTEPD